MIIRLRLVSKEKDYLKRLSKSSHITQKILDNDLIAIQKNKVLIRRNKPAYFRMCILGLSKVLMYEFHYNYIKNKYDNKTRLLFTDANSIMYEIKTEDVYEDFKRDKKCLF